MLNADPSQRPVFHDSGVLLQQEARWILLSLKKPRPVEEVVKDTGLVVAQPEKIIQDGKINHTERQLWLESIAGVASHTESITMLRANLGQDIEWITSAYRFPGTNRHNGVLAVVPNTLLVTAKKDQDNTKLHAVLAKYGLSLNVDISKYLPGYYSYALDLAGGHNVWDLQRALPEREPGLVPSAKFVFMPMFVLSAQFTPNDQYYTSGAQWNLPQIHAPQAWNSTTPPTCGQNTRVAVIDQEGCDLTHPDLAEAWAPGATFDGSTMTTGLQGGAARANTSDAHGTNSAGVIGARYNNNGIAGLAGNCQVMPLRFMTWQTPEIAAAITYAANNGADVISMSFGGDGSNGDYLYDTVIKNAISYAHNQKHVVLCAATMNKGESKIYYPAGDPLVMACGASDTVDTRTQSSNYGNYTDPITGVISGYLSVVAPGIGVPTTHNYVSPRTHDPKNDYEFADGTSIATPHVAGLAALIISRFSSAKGQPLRVRRCIERGAFKNTAVYAYSAQPGKPHGDWNDQTGYGRIDALRAFEKAAAEFSEDDRPPAAPQGLRIQ